MFVFCLFVGWLFICLFGWLVVCSSLCFFVSLFLCFFVGGLAVCLVGWLAGWSFGCLLICLFVCLFVVSCWSKHTHCTSCIFMGSFISLFIVINNVVQMVTDFCSLKLF